MPKKDDILKDFPYDGGGHYRVLLADPPWDFKNWSAKGEKKHAKQHYNVMELMDIMTIPVAHLVHEEGAVCFMWTAAPYIPDSLTTLRCWGFKYKTMFPWVKMVKDMSKPAFGTGYILRSAAEFVLVGTFAKAKKKDTKAARSQRNVVLTVEELSIFSRRRKHSEKPPEAFDLIEALYPGPYMELFARSRRPGWDSWGDQLGRDG